MNKLLYLGQKNKGVIFRQQRLDISHAYKKGKYGNERDRIYSNKSNANADQSHTIITVQR